MNHPKRSIVPAVGHSPRVKPWPLDLAFEPMASASTLPETAIHDTGPTWMTVREAAHVLAMSIDALHMALARRARRNADGSVAAEWDGISARKIGRRWRIALSSRWRSDPADNETRAPSIARSA